ncbi:MAG: hypothetical protein JNL08_20785 [Planctomycetes bacterium]|nr:hypothetical protein [Planctomycetota bacterium]
MDDPALPPLPSTPAKKSRGCLFYVGISAIVLVLVFGVGGYFAVRWMLDQMAAVLEQYSDPTPMELPRATMSDDDYRALTARLDAFTAPRTDADRTLSLSGDDLNALIERHPAWQAMRGRLHLQPVDDQLEVQIAFPLDLLAGQLPGMSGVAGRFVNATARLQANYAGGRLHLDLRAVQVKGQALSAQVMGALREPSLLQRISEPYERTWRDHVEQFRVDGSRLVVTAKPAR